MFIDYRAGHRVTFAALLAEYIEDAGFKTLKGYADYKTTLKGMLADSVGKLARAQCLKLRWLLSGHRCEVMPR